MIHLDFPRSTAQKETLCTDIRNYVQGLHFIQKGHQKIVFFYKEDKENAWWQSYLKADRTGDPDFNTIAWNHSPNQLTSSLNDWSTQFFPLQGEHLSFPSWDLLRKGLICHDWGCFNCVGAESDLECTKSVIEVRGNFWWQHLAGKR